MRKYFGLSNIARAGEDFRGYEIVIDTNAFKYRWDGGEYRYVVSHGIFNELKNNPGEFPVQLSRQVLGGVWRHFYVVTLLCGLRPCS